LKEEEGQGKTPPYAQYVCADLSHTLPLNRAQAPPLLLNLAFNTQAGTHLTFSKNVAGIVQCEAEERKVTKILYNCFLLLD